MTGRESAELDQASLVRMQSQRELLQPLTQILLRNELPPRWQRPIGAAMYARMQIHQSNFQLLLVLPPSQAMHSRRRVPLKPGKGRPQQIDAHMVK